MVGAKPIIPNGDMFDIAKIKRAIENALTNIAQGIEADYKVTTRTWRTQVDFKVDQAPFRRVIYTYSPIYKFVDEGTPPHTIRAKTPDGLSFSWGPPYRAKTVPRRIASRAGLAGGNFASNLMQVEHPGTKPREFTKTIKHKWVKQARKILQRAIDSEVG